MARPSAILREAPTPELWLSKGCRLKPSSVSRLNVTRMYSWRSPLLARSKPAGTSIQSEKGRSQACMDNRAGRTSSTKVTNAETGFPGKPKNCLPHTLPLAKGLPGLMASLHISRPPRDSTAGLMWSSSPTETPPVLMMTSTCLAAVFNTLRVVLNSSPTTPISMTSAPRFLSNAAIV